jgi:hypothetical protein
VGTFKDQLELKRIGSKSCKATVTIHLDMQPERFNLDPRLVQVSKVHHVCTNQGHMLLRYLILFIVVANLDGYSVLSLSCRF